MWGSRRVCRVVTQRQSRLLRTLQGARGTLVWRLVLLIEGDALADIVLGPRSASDGGGGTVISPRPSDCTA